MGQKIRKDVDILALTSQIQELQILLPKKSASQYKNKNINVGNTRVNNDGSSWKLIAPTFGESWTKEKNGRTWHWCKWHEYWTATHNSRNFRTQHDTVTNKNNSTESSDKKTLNINLESPESDSITDEFFSMTTSVETNYHIASDEIDRIFDGNAINCTEVKHSTSDDSEQLK